MVMGFSKIEKQRAALEQQLQLSIGETTALQARATEPDSCVWVSANAGTGKTHVLVNRVLRVLLTGMPPEKLLCLTYTNAAAAEMSNRLFGVLAKWAVMSHQELIEAFLKLEGRNPNEEELNAVRTLFARTLETPGSLKIQTIHSFCDRLLRRFPLEAGIVPNSSLMDEQMASEIRKEAEEKVLRRGANNPDSQLGRALRAMIIYAAEDRFSQIIGDALSKKDVFYGIYKEYGDQDDPIGAHIKTLTVELGLPEGLDAHSLEKDQAALLSDNLLSSLYEALNQGTKTDIKTATYIKESQNATSVKSRVEQLSKALLTTTGDMRKSLMTKKVKEANPDLLEAFCQVQEQFFDLAVQKQACLVRDATESLLRVGSAILEEYEKSKANRASLDFDDLIDKSANLLSGSDDSAWVLFKLDGGLDHIMVDEAQDTSPQQWGVILGLAEEFFAGQGAHEERSENPRTVFAVGDEKQSIYSFQGAVPAEFANTGSALQQKVEQAGQRWQNIPLTLNFRSTSAVLESVDHAFADGDTIKGLSFSGKKIEHKAAREGQAGRIEIWPIECPEELEKSPVWWPETDTTISDEPINVLAEKIAATIARWLKTGEILHSLGRPVRPGDILILLRRRQPFATPMIRALKKYNIPVAGADRMKLMEQIAVEDLVALGDFMLLPEDDLALATILKSPLFGLDDTQLFDISYGRKKSLWSVLNGKATEDAALADIVMQLRAWLKRADQMPPFELFSSVLEVDGARRKLMSRLGAEAGDAIDEFLNLALRYDSNHPPSLQAFLESLRENTSDIKRDMEQSLDEVRIMTVHGAKGLEANVVFLPDTVSQKRQDQPVLKTRSKFLAEGMPDQLIWKVSGTGHVDMIKALKAEHNLAGQEEYNRLLYVALTRARDRLYVCGWENRKSKSDRGSDGCWYQIMKTTLEPFMTKVPFEAGVKGEHVFRLDQEQILKVKTEDAIADNVMQNVAMPSWAQNNAPSDAMPVRRFSPSRMGGMSKIDRLNDVISEEDEDVLVRDGLSLGGQSNPEDIIRILQGDAVNVGEVQADLANDGENKPRYDQLLRGTLTHALLEHLPKLPPEQWDMAAEQLVRGYMLTGTENEAEQKSAKKLPEAVLFEMMEEVFAILANEEMAFLFADNTKAEVSFQVEVPAKSEKKRATRISGQIDRLIVEQDKIIVIDYKSNRDVPSSESSISDDYMVQLAAYRLGVRKIFPDKDVQCGLLWTATGQLMMIDTVKMQTLEAQLIADLQSGNLK